MQVNMSRNRLSKLMGVNPQSTLSVEMIDEQRNDWFITKLIEDLKDLKEIARRNGETKTTALLKNPEAAIIIDKMEANIEKRFGIKILIKVGDKGELAARSYFNIYDSVIHNIGSNYSQYWREQLANIGAFRNEDGTDLADSVRDNRISDSIYRDVKLGNGRWTRVTAEDAAMYRAVKALKEKLKTSGLIIDRKKAYVSGLPKEYVSFIYIDFVTYLNRLDEIPEEVASSIMHEIGHIWTFIEYSVKHVYNTTALIDSMQDAATKGKSAKETLYYIADHVDIPDDEKKKIKSKSLIPAVLYFIHCYASENTYPGNDIENLADRFCTRFGLGEYLGTSLEKETPEMYRHYYFRYGAGFSSFMLVTVSVIYSLIFALAQISGLLLITVPFIGIYVIYLMYKKFFGSSKVPNIAHLKDVAQYDEFADRIKRIKFEMIRMIKSSDSYDDPQYKKEMLDSIDTLERIISAVPPPSKGLIASIGKFFTPKYILDRHKLEQIDKELEALMENDLYLATLKLELINNKG